MANINFEQTDIFGLLEDEKETTTLSVDEIAGNNESQKQPTTEETTTQGGFQKVITQESKDKKAEEEEKKKISTFEDTKKETSSKAKSSASKSGVGDEFKIKTDTVVKYAGRGVPVTRYFSVDEIQNGILKKKKDEEIREPISETDLIKKLNQDFAELVPKLTSLVYYEKKNIVIPVLEARKKGFSSPLRIRIPFQLLRDFIAIAKKYSDQYGTEVHADIYYDYDQQDFFMDFPKQRVHEVWAERIEEPAETALKFIDRNYRKVMEIHSHHRMAPIPSATDNAAERSPILYAIVGRIDCYFPEITVRTFNPKTQKHIPLKVEQVFEYPFSQTSIDYNLDGVEVTE